MGTTLYKRLDTGEFVPAAPDDIRQAAFQLDHDPHEELVDLPCCPDCPIDLTCPRHPRCVFECAEDLANAEKF